MIFGEHLVEADNIILRERMKSKEEFEALKANNTIVAACVANGLPLERMVVELAKHNQRLFDMILEMQRLSAMTSVFVKSSKNDDSDVVLTQ